MADERPKITADPSTDPVGYSEQWRARYKDELWALKVQIGLAGDQENAAQYVLLDMQQRGWLDPDDAADLRALASNAVERCAAKAEKIADDFRERLNFAGRMFLPFEQHKQNEELARQIAADIRTLPAEVAHG